MNPRIDFIFVKAVLKVIVDFPGDVDWIGRSETPAGIRAGQGRPRRR
jgi:hypothetical protein